MGSAVGQAVLGPKHQGKGFLIGGLAGTLPDLDVIPLMNSSVISQLMHHRGFSHSVLFCLTMPFLCSWISKKVFKWSISFNRWFTFWFLAFFTHIILDLMTTWGTQILWPYTHRYALDSLFIIDPLVTLPLIVGCIIAKLKKSTRAAIWGMTLSGLYCTFALSANLYMSHQFAEQFAKKNIPIIKQLVKPTPFNTLFWSTTAITTNDTLVMGYARLWDPSESIVFDTPINRNSETLNKTTHPEIQQLLTITKGYYLLEQTPETFTIKDARFGRFGGWDNANKSHFIFNYSLDKQENTWSQYRPTDINEKALLKSLIERILASH